MADDKPTTWSLSNQTIGNRETQVDKRLTTITPQNTTGFVPLNSNSNDRLVKELEYSIRTDGIVVYRVPSLNNRQFNNIQEIAGAGFPRYDATTTLKIKNDLTEVLRKETENKILKGTGVSPFAQTAPPQDETQQTLDITPGDLTNLEIKSKDQRTKYGPPEHLRYPNDLKNQDVITFTMRKYTAPSGLQTDGAGNSFTGIVNKKEQSGTPLGTVVLPIQPTIIDDNSVRWNDDSLNPLELAALSLSTGAIGGGIDGANAAIQNMTNIIQGAEGQNIKKGLLTGAAGAAIGRNVLARVSGAILNPNIELLFNGPSLRVFNYRFQLSPRSDIETRNIMKIIRFFKQGMAVQRSPENLFLKTPNIFEVKYLLKDAVDHPYINRIKTCALTRCSVDYTPTGSYMTFPDGGMVSYSLNLTFEELEPIYSDDYDKIDGGTNTNVASIGF